MDKLERLLERADRLLERLERTLPKPRGSATAEWGAALAFRWENKKLAEVPHFHRTRLDDLLGIVSHWLRHFGAGETLDETVRQAALQWSIQRGSRSGRVAWQFARDQAGRQNLPG